MHTCRHYQPLKAGQGRQTGAGIQRRQVVAAAIQGRQLVAGIKGRQLVAGIQGRQLVAGIQGRLVQVFRADRFRADRCVYSRLQQHTIIHNAAAAHNNFTML